jgi:ABC-type antimicrobial peptide transport system permease subunit
MDGMESLAQNILAGINPNLTVVRFQTFDNQIAECFGQERLLSRLTMLFGALALLLAAIGLYGVTSYSVVRRSPEIGIRMALGADRSTVMSMILRSATNQTALGLLLGIPVALLCVRFVKSQLYEIAKVDLGVMAISIALLALAAFVAAVIPARRAASINPVSALRMD